MNTYMNDLNLKSLDQVRCFLEGATGIEFKSRSKKECYTWIQGVLTRFRYQRLSRHDKGIVFAYVQKVTGYCRQQISNLIKQHRDTNRVALVS